MKTWIIASTLSAPLVVGALAIAPGCVPTSDEPLACRDGSCAHQETNTFCDIDGAYPGTEASNECIAPPADDACNRAVECTDPAAPYCDDDSMGTCVECTDNTHCTIDGESCNPISGLCTDVPVLGCTPGTEGDATCAADNDVGDYCSDDEVCATCLVDDHCDTNVAQAVCDQALLECRGCELGGDDCTSGICGAVDEGVCVDEDNIVYVDAAATGGAGCGTQAAPCKTITDGLAATTETRNVVSVAAGDYPERLAIATSTIAIVGTGVVTINPPANGDTKVVSVTGDADLTFRGIDITNENGAVGSDAVECNSALTLVNSTVRGSRDIGIEGDNCTLAILDSNITGNTGIGISATGGTIEVRRSTIASNAGGGLDIDAATYAIQNSVIVENGADGASGSSRGGVYLSGATPGLFSFNTLAGNGVQNGAIFGAGLTCGGATVEAANNIIVAAGQAGGQGLVFGSCNLSYTLTDDGSPADGTGNIIGTPLFLNPAMTDYSIPATSPAHDAADPAATLTIDVLGNPRPVGAGPDMGAHEVQ